MEQRFNKIISIFVALAVVILITAAGVFVYKNHKISKGAKQYFLASTFNSQEAYSEIFSKLQNPTKNANAVAGIVSHHFLAKQPIAEFYNTVSSDKVTTVFLLSPDHYNNNFKQDSIAYTSYLDWTTPFGDLDVDNSATNALLKTNNIEINDSAMGLEHGIYVEIPFIKKFFPNAKIVTLVLKSNLSDSSFLSFGESLKNVSGQNSMLIVSSDFTHNATPDQSKANDKKSIDALNNLSQNSFNQVTNDCKQCLATLAGFLNDSQYSFSLTANQNSFDISGQDENSVTSYVFGYYTKKDYVQILFTGDLMFDRGIRYYANKNGGNNFIFKKISPTLAENDLVVSNLEGPITANKSVSSGTVPGSTNNYFFTFDPSVAETLFKQNIKLVDLGNNHILNFGSAGLKSTQEYLNKANVDYFGVPNGKRSVVKTIGGVKIAFISYNEFAGDTSKIITDEIKKIKPEADIVIIFAHWGVEYNLNATEDQKSLAHQFVDAGADLVIGSHPHVIEPMEEYNGKRIYYSLGNFIFDQYFSEDTRNSKGVVVKIDKQTKHLDFSEKPFYLQSGGQTIIK